MMTTHSCTAGVRRGPEPVLRHFPAAALALAMWACGGSSVPVAEDDPGPRLDSNPGGDLFTDVASEVGLEFTHFNGMSGEFYMAEITGPGGALLDYDNDGRLDLYAVQGQMIGPGKTLDDALFPPAEPAPLSDRLYRNEPVVDTVGPSLRFVDVTDEAGIRAEGYGMGVAVGDYSNSGWVDIYVTNLGSNQLWRNNGDGTFADTTAESGTDDPRWSVPATFFDSDRNGWLDLFVGNYIAADLVDRVICRDFIGLLDYCGPGAYPALPDRLFRNRKDGSFEDVTHAAGLRRGFGPALGVVAVDLDGSGWPDLYVANDAQPNNLWVNQGDGTFRDEALLAGVSVNAQGKAEASMGIALGDIDEDGHFDIFLTHLTGETNTLYENDGRGIFRDVTAASGLGPPSLSFTAFGTGWIDLYNDGRLDLLVVNGAVKRIEALARERDPFPLHQINQLFRNRGAGRGGIRFEELTGSAGAVFALSEVSRGVAFGDVDNDGLTDLVIFNNNAPLRLLIQDSGRDAHWLGVRAVGGTPPRDQLGTRVALWREDGSTLWRRVATDGSYAAASDPRAIFGLGDDPTFRHIEVHWPDGTVEAWHDLEPGRYHTLRYGEGATPAGPEGASR